MSDHISEGDVETRVIVPAIDELGYPSSQVDSKLHVTFTRGTRTEYGFADYALFLLADEGGNVYTLVIEGKKPSQDWEEAKSQARSYATSAQINSPFYAVFDNSQFELYDQRYPHDPVVKGEIDSLYAGSSLLDQLKSYVSPLAAAEFLRRNWGREVPKSVLGELDTIRHEVSSQVEKQVGNYIGGRLVGRDAVVSNILDVAAGSASQVIAVMGAVGVGKSAIATEVYRSIPQQAKAVYYFSKTDPFFNKEETFYRFLCAQLFPTIAPGRVSKIGTANRNSALELFRDTVKGLCVDSDSLPQPIVVVVDGVDQVSPSTADNTAGILSSLAHDCAGLTLVVSSQPPLPKSVTPTVAPIVVGLLDSSSANQMWDSGRTARQPSSSTLGAGAPRLPIKMKLALQYEGNTMEALLRNATDDIVKDFEAIWTVLTERQRQALAFVCTDLRVLTKQELAQLLSLSPSSSDFEHDFESICRLLEATTPFVAPLDVSLRGFVASQLSEKQIHSIWNELFAMRESQAEGGGHVDLYPYLEKALGGEKFAEWVSRRLQSGNANDFSALDSVWERIKLSEYGDEETLRLEAATKTASPLAGRNRRRELVAWIVENPDRLDELRQKILEIARSAPEGESHNAVQCLIDMRDASVPVLQQLHLFTGDSVAEKRADGARGLVLLGSKDDRTTAVQALSDLIRSKYVSHQVFVAASIASDSSLVDSIAAALSGQIDDEDRTDLLVSVMARVAEKNLSDSTIQKAVADIIVSLHDRKSTGNLLLSGDVSGAIDYPSIADKLLYLLDPENGIVHARHLVYIRTTELSLPSPLERLPSAAHNMSDNALDIVRHDITDDSKNNSPWQDWHHKEWATQFACFCAIAQSRDWIAHALKDSSPYVVNWACDYAAALGLGASVPLLTELLRPESHDLVRIGATKTLGILAGTESVAALIAHPLEIDGHVLQSGAEALSSAALSSGLVGYLCDVAADENTASNSRAVCIGALERIAHLAKDTITCSRTALWRIIDDSALEEWCRATCLKILGALDASDDELARLVELAQGGESSTSWAAMQTLAAWQKLGEYPDLTKTVSDVLRSTDEAGREPELVLLTLYRNNPAMWASLVAERISANSLTTLLNVHLDSSVPEVVRNALLDLLERSRSVFIAQADVVGVMAECAPEELLRRLQDERPFGLVPKYGPDVADALGFVASRHDDMRSAAAHELASLCAFSDLATRRSAADVLARLDAALLAKTAEDLLVVTDSVDSMVAGADCVAYVESDDDFMRLIELVEFAPYPSLRIYGMAIRRDRYNLLLADRHLDILKRAMNEDILGLWRYGMAVAQVGDRRHYGRLREMAGDEHYRANVRFWFGWLAKDGEEKLVKRLEKRQRDLDSR